MIRRTRTLPTKIFDLIHLIYSAAGDSQQWSQVLELTADCFNGASTTLLYQDMFRTSDSVAVAVRTHSEFIRDYERHFAAINPWMQQGMGDLLSGSVLTGDMVIKATDLKKTEFYNDFLRPYQLIHVIGGNILKDHEVMTNLSILGERDLEPYRNEDIRNLEMIMPHLQHAFRLHRQLGNLRTMSTSMEAALNYTSTAFIVLDSEGQLIFANQPAEKILKLRNTFCLKNNQVAVLNPQDHDAFLHRIRLARNNPPSGGTITIRSVTNNSCYEVTIWPFKIQMKF
jgi:PAS domain-containing protein